MKSFSVISTLLFVCALALVQVWAAPVEPEAIETNEVFTASPEEQAFNEWYDAVYQQSVAHDVFPAVRRIVIPPFPPYPPPPTFPPYPPPPTFPPFPPRW